MIRQYLFIEKYSWHLVVLYKANRDLEAVAEELLALRCPSKLAIKAIKVASTFNSGFCYTNDLMRASLICVAEADSDEEFVNTIAHETRHLQSHICSYYNIDEKGEEAAYLLGDTFEKLFKIFKYELDEFKISYKKRYKNKQQSRNYWRDSSEYSYHNCKLSWSKCYICGSGNSKH